MSSFYTYITLFFIALSGSLIVVWKKPAISQNFKLLLSFSGAFLLAICFLHLIPELYKNYSTSIGLFILLGFVLQLLLEFFSQGIEHGHLHIHKKEKRNFPVTIFLSLCIHSLVEGMALTNTHHHDENTPLLLGVLIHKLPVAIILSTLLIGKDIKGTPLLASIIVFALSAPIGLFFADEFGDSIINNINFLLALAVGIFLHISTTILFEASEGHKFHLKKFAIIVVGLLVAYFTM
ncbi:MAG: ZIP family metal transporter [Flavobacteriales bacterium]|nr:ZIP family metal transporter [Flavobacteriales bacterium]